MLTQMLCLDNRLFKEIIISGVKEISICIIILLALWCIYKNDIMINVKCTEILH